MAWLYGNNIQLEFPNNYLYNCWLDYDITLSVELNIWYLKTTLSRCWARLPHTLLFCNKCWTFPHYINTLFTIFDKDISLTVVLYKLDLMGQYSSVAKRPDSNNWRSEIFLFRLLCPGYYKFGVRLSIKMRSYPIWRFLPHNGVILLFFTGNLLGWSWKSNYI